MSSSDENEEDIFEILQLWYDNLKTLENKRDNTRQWIDKMTRCELDHTILDKQLIVINNKIDHVKQIIHDLIPDVSLCKTCDHDDEPSGLNLYYMCTKCGLRISVYGSNLDEDEDD